MKRIVAALFVQTAGPYFGLPNVDPWDLNRDARNYKGPHPVVAHPPCQLWGKFAKINYARWGGEHNKPGNDGGCFIAALKSVRRFGGVLEHPAFSYAWEAHGLTKPQGLGWAKVADNEWVCEVWQSAYGHAARKRTWLFYSGKNPPASLRWERKDGTHQIGGHDQRGKAKNKPTISGKRASATPTEFRDALIDLALGSTVSFINPRAHDAPVIPDPSLNLTLKPHKNNTPALYGYSVVKIKKTGKKSSS